MRELAETGRIVKRIVVTRVKNAPLSLVNTLGSYNSGNIYCIVGQRRSGHHAIINWIRCNLGASSVFFNDCSCGFNPALTHVSADVFHPAHGSEQPVSLSATGDWDKSSDHHIIYNYEDHSLRRIRIEESAINRSAWFGKARRYTRVHVIRDPFNLLASKLRWSLGQEFAPPVSSLYRTRDQWAEYARYYLKRRDALGEEVFIDYNSWFLAAESRATYAELLGLQGHDRGMDKVARYGPTVWGDSFDGLRYDGKAREMKVMERWKEFDTNETYRSLINHEPLIQLSNRLYGHIPDIRDAIDFAESLPKHSRAA